MKIFSGLLPSLILISLFYYTTEAGSFDEELEVILQFFEFDLEDVCMLKSEAQWEFLNGTKTNLNKLLDLELKEAALYKNESHTLQKVHGNTFSNKRLQRLFDIFSHPGSPLLGATELKEYKQYSVKLQEIQSKMTIGCPEKVTSEDYEELKNDTEKACEGKNRKDVNRILATELNEGKLKSLWSEWYDELESQNRKTKFDFMQQLSILDIEAEYNEEDDLADYWLKQADISKLDYHKISQLWKEIIPLYQKIRNFMANAVEKKYGTKVLINKKIFPAHLFGSLRTENWIITAEKLGALDDAEPYTFLASKLKAMHAEDAYRMADKFTAEFKIGDLPEMFYNNSRFNVTAPNCNSKLMDYCSWKSNHRVISCSGDDVTMSRFMEIHEEVAKLKHLSNAGKEGQEEENGFLFREGPRDSVIYEAVAGLSSLIAVRPKNLRKQELLPSETFPNEEIVSLMLSALHVIPSLPYYLAADLWRINAMREMDASAGETPNDFSSTMSWSTTVATDENDSYFHSDVRKRDISDSSSHGNDSETGPAATGEKNKTEESFRKSESIPTPRVSYMTTTERTLPKVYDFDNLTVDWWKYRENLQGIGNSGDKLYADFLQDEKIIWNKAYVSKFLGQILQFQLLEYFRHENATVNSSRIQSLLQKGKSKPYEEILEVMFNITEISTAPLLLYFKPLEDFIDAGGRFKNDTTSVDPDDLNLFSDSYSMNSQPGDEGVKAQQGSNTIVFALLIAAALGIIAITLLIALKRRRRKQRAKDRKKRLNELLN